MFFSVVQGDILSPLTSLSWTSCCKAPGGIPSGAQSVCLEDKVYIEGDGKELYIYTPATDTWDTMDTPVYWYALTVYCSQLVLVGGMLTDGSVTTKLWTLVGRNRWRVALPPMSEGRRNASAVEYSNNILVAGGYGDSLKDITSVEVYNGHHWVRAQSLPRVCFGQSAIVNGHWYLKGYTCSQNFYYASVDSLICQPSQGNQCSLWKKLAANPDFCSMLVVFGNRLVTVGKSDIQAYSPYSRSWIHVGDSYEKIHGTPYAAATHPSGDLLVVTYDGCVYRASLSGKLIWC